MNGSERKDVFAFDSLRPLKYRFELRLLCRDGGDDARVDSAVAHRAKKIAKRSVGVGTHVAAQRGYLSHRSLGKRIYERVGMEIEVFHVRENSNRKIFSGQRKR